MSDLWEFTVRFASSILAIAIASAAIPAPTSAGQHATPRDVLAKVTDAYNKGDCATTVSLVTPLIDLPGSLPGTDLALAYDLAISCAAKAGDVAKAGDLARRATKLPEASDLAWRILLASDLDAKKNDAALDTLERMAQEHATALNGTPLRWLWELRRRFDRAHDDAGDTRLLRIMAGSAYHPDDIGAEIDNSGDHARALYARKLLAAGKSDEARALIANLHGYNAAREAALDPKLNALLAKPIDLRVVVEAELAQHRAMMGKYPKSLDVINAVALDLYRLGRNDEAITMLKALLPRVASDDGFDDRDEKLPWFWNSLAYAFGATGQYDAMVDAFTKGGEIGESGLPNVSQVINLGFQQVAFGRGKDALATIRPLGDSPAASPYGLLQIRLVRGCANALLGQIDKARPELAYAVAHAEDDPVAVTFLSLCIGDEAAAAKSYIDRLAGDGRARMTAMLELAEYDAPDPRTPVDPFAATRDRVQKRADVQAAVRAAGGPMRIRLRHDPF